MRANEPSRALEAKEGGHRGTKIWIKLTLMVKLKYSFHQGKGIIIMIFSGISFSLNEEIWKKGKYSQADLAQPLEFNYLCCERGIPIAGKFSFISSLKPLWYLGFPWNFSHSPFSCKSLQIQLSLSAEQLQFLQAAPDTVPAPLGSSGFINTPMSH